MNKVTKVVLLIVILTALVAWAVYPRLDDLFPKGKDKSNISTTNVANNSLALPVNAVVATPKFLENKIKITGSLLPNESVTIMSEVAGMVTEIMFEEGQKVRKGDLLLRLKDDELRAQLEKLKYSRKLAQETENRQRQLLEKEAISQEEYDITLTNLNTSEADIKLLQTQIERTYMRAPFDGILGLRQISEGAYITSSTSITTLYNLDPMKVAFAIPGKYVNKVNVGDEIAFSTEVSNQLFKGEVYAIEPQIEANTRTVQIRAYAGNKDAQLIPGQFAKVELLMERIEDALMLPAYAVIPELNGHKLFLVKDGKAIQRMVQIGVRTESEVQILEGLNPQDTVITSGLLEIRPGIEVKLKSINN